FRCLLADPESELIRRYAADRQEPDLLETIETSKTVLTRLAEEINAEKPRGSFEVYLYSHFPYCASIIVDGDDPDGRMLVSHYLYGTRRADTPHLVFGRQ